MTASESANGSGAVLASKAADQKFCFSCSAVLHSSATTCTKCGANQPVQNAIAPIHTTSSVTQGNQVPLPPMHVYCRGCGQAVHESARSCPKCGATLNPSSAKATLTDSGLDRMTAALLAFFLGAFGGHKFYLGKPVQGIFYLLFFWTFIPAIIAFIEGVIFLTMSDSEFSRKY